MTTNTLPTSVTLEPAQRVVYGRLWWVGLLAIVLSTVANLIVRIIGVALVPIAPEFLPVSIAMPTIIFTVVGVLAGVIVFAIVGRFSRRPARTYTIIGVVALLLSLVPNVMMIVDPSSAPFPGVTPAAAVILMVQHVVAGVITIWLLTTQAVETLPAGK
jgi:hypothetical protein